MATMTATAGRTGGLAYNEKFVIFASSLGTIFEWYDFYLYAVLAPFFAALFFPPGNDTAALLSAFATYAAGLLLALVMIGICRESMDVKAFSQWGWRVPFLLSVVLLAFSIYIRLKLNETPIFQKMKEEGKGSKRPLTDSFLRYPNNKYVLLALLGATAGQGVVWYTGQFYALFFLIITLKVDYLTAYKLIGLSLKTESAPGKPVSLTVGTAKVEGWDAAKWTAALTSAGYPKAADPNKINWPMTEFLLVIMVIYVTMVYGPIAAFLVELFPTQIRYTSMSLPYHIGNGWFGGMLPLLATALVAATGDIYYGLWYPIGVAIMSFVIGTIFLHATENTDNPTGAAASDARP